ncbi:MAG: class I adenylate-forming enzyme family protein [Ideonella sp.]
MTRQQVLSIQVPGVEERIRQIESEPLPANIDALLDAAAAEVPDRVAFNFFESGESFTYAELRGRVDRLASGLSRRGIQPGTHVGVMLPNVAAMPLTWLALMRIGAVMVPMNIAYTSREIVYIIENGDVEALILDSDCLPALDELATLPGNLDASRIFVFGSVDHAHARWDELLIESAKPDVPRHAVALDDVANIQYTSGTTGFPKGCVLSHRYWLTISKVNAWRDGMSYRNILCATPFFYMDPQWQLLMAFHQRATLFVARRQSPSRFMGWVREHKINFCLLPHLVFKQPANPADKDNELVKCNVYGLPKGSHAAIEERFDLIAREAFGMTEAGTCLFVPISATEMVGSGSCGKPGPFRQARIVGEDGKPVAAGVEGELQVRGPGMLQRYYKNPQATADAFDGDWFRTGDLFRQDERGYYYIVGRLKDMIRRSSENIAAREIESVMSDLPAISEVAAVPVPDETRGEEVKVYVVLREGLAADDLPPQAIIEHCVQRLAKFKVPRYVAYCNELPKTPSGKIAKKVLTGGVEDLRVGSYDRIQEKWL